MGLCYNSNNRQVQDYISLGGRVSRSTLLFFLNNLGIVIKTHKWEVAGVVQSEAAEKCPVIEAQALSAGIQSSRIMDASVTRYAETL